MQPIEYKLIPFPNEEGEGIIISDEDILLDDWVANNENFPDITIYKSWNIKGKFSTRRKLIASTKFIDKSIPLIRREQLIFPISTTVQELANNAWYKCKIREVSHNIFELGCIAGINEHAKTHPFTLEDIEKAIWYGYDIGGAEVLSTDSERDEKERPDNIKDFIKSLQQPKKEYIVELEMEYYSNPEDGHSAIHKEQRPKVDKEGYVNILSIK